MLLDLRISNLAVVTQARIEFKPGLNVLTGETGAGKSIVVDALGLLVGGRATQDLLRTGESRAVIEGVFELTQAAAETIAETLAPLGLDDLKEGELLIRREISAGGRGRFYVNDCSVTNATLRRLQPFLVEIHGQSEQQQLLASRSHMDLLDDFAGCAALRGEVAAAYARHCAASEDLRSLERDEAERERAAEYIKYQLAAIDEVNPQPDEELILAAEKHLLLNGGRVLEACASAYAALYESDASALASLSMARRRLQELSGIDARFVEAGASLETAAALIEDVAGALRSYQSEIDFSPARLAETESRLEELERLRRKLGVELNAACARREELAAELEKLENVETRRAELRAEVDKAARLYAEKANELTRHRREAAQSLAAHVTDELAQMAMEKARFVVRVETGSASNASDNAEGGRERLASRLSHAKIGESANEEFFEFAKNGSFFSPRGADAVEFEFSANVGEAAKPLSRVASGGELSRVMLALRTCVQRRRREGAARGQDSSLAGDALRPTLIFDEIDAGTGGRVTSAIGKRLKTLSESQQILCVTHQPQIARYAYAHFVVTKEIEGGRTHAFVRELDEKGRVGELARMIGGAEDVRTARAAARWMLKKDALDGAENLEAEAQSKR